MRARSKPSARSGIWDTARLEWRIGLQRLPFFTQRLAVGLLGLLVVSLALVGAMAIISGGPQSSDLPLRPPPEGRYPVDRPSGDGTGPPHPPPVRAGGQVPASARSSAASSFGSTSTTSRSTRSTSSVAPASSAARRSTTSAAPPTSGDDPEPPLTVPPVLTTLLR